MPFSSLIEAFVHHVRNQPEHTALIFESSENHVRRCTWRELSVAVSYFADDLCQRFDAEPDLPRRIGYASDNSFADVVIALASMSIGAVEVPIDHRLPEDEIRARWARVGGLWVDQQLRAQPHGLLIQNRSVNPTNIDVDSDSLILWTSGTTGTPQGVTLSHRNLVGNAVAKLEAVPQQSRDIRLSVLPISHAYARTCDFGTWLLSGCTLAITLGFAGLERMAPKVHPTLINAVPSLANRMLQEDGDTIGLDRLRLLGCGGAAISETAFRRWSDRGVDVIQGYGLTETGPVIASATPEDASPGLVGRIVNGWESDVRDGQLFVRGPHIMRGYWDDAEATSRKIDGDGWLATGDLVELDPETDQLRILGRVDEVIVLDNGNKLFPSVVQRDVEQVPGVHHAILLHNGHLELWYDSDEAEDSDDSPLSGEIKRVLAMYPGCHDCRIHRFAPQLRQSAGELTSKGTVRRHQVLENRFTSA